MQAYLTVTKRAEAEQTIRGSRFIGYVCPVDSTEACEAFFEEIRKLHRQATHNVPAYVLGDAMQLQWAGDDGEPRGTSGAPMVHMLAAEGISDTAVMVTRYFGGVRLGTGGLVRAYTGTARLAIRAAGLSRVSEQLVFSCEMDYAEFHRIEAAAGGAYTLLSPRFTERVCADAIAAPAQRELALSQLRAAAPAVRIAGEKTETIKTEIEMP
ncbi:MAG: IMPACT family protein [Clostridiales Family XIII bacterium]|jgi:uncharacterized YigZ family protein|nr:IMPACT family protein [Clostridiales Family XIII bacterium]